jgi:hypothetical protein
LNNSNRKWTNDTISLGSVHIGSRPAWPKWPSPLGPFGPRLRQGIESAPLWRRWVARGQGRCSWGASPCDGDSNPGLWREGHSSERASSGKVLGSGEEVDGGANKLLSIAKWSERVYRCVWFSSRSLRDRRRSGDVSRR